MRLKVTGSLIKSKLHTEFADLGLDSNSQITL